DWNCGMWNRNPGGPRRPGRAGPTRTRLYPPPRQGIIASRPTSPRSAMRALLALPLLLALATLTAAEAPPASGTLEVKEADDHVRIDTDAIQARVRKKGYVSGIAQGSFLDKRTGARDLGFGLHIMDFLLAPGWRDDGYSRDPLLHGREKKKGAAPGKPGYFDLSKHYVEGPQICTQARELKPEIVRGKDFVAVTLRYTFHKPGKGYRAGSTWEQVMVFQPGVRYVLSSETVTSVNEVKDLFYRIDMPGHLR